MKSLACAVLALGLVLVPARANGVPWTNGTSVLKATQADIATSGVRGVGVHVEDIEKALDECSACFPRYDTGAGDIFVLTSGPNETLFALMAAGVDQKNGKGRTAKVVAMPNPYPLLAFYLGSYYNELRRYDDAVRVMEKGLKLDAEPGFCDAAPLLTSERALALASLGRLDEALAGYDGGLKLPMIDDRGKARMQRGRGYVLTELSRLDEAETAYQESLKYEPGNKRALDELAYIARLKAGAPKLPSTTGMPNTPSKAN